MSAKVDERQYILSIVFKNKENMLAAQKSLKSLAKTEEDIIKLNHYTNLRPLCSYNNRFVKRNK